MFDDCGKLEFLYKLYLILLFLYICFGNPVSLEIGLLFFCSLYFLFLTVMSQDVRKMSWDVLGVAQDAPGWFEISWQCSRKIQRRLGMSRSCPRQAPG